MRTRGTRVATLAVVMLTAVVVACSAGATTQPVQTQVEADPASLQPTASPLPVVQERINRDESDLPELVVGTSVTGPTPSLSPTSILTPSPTVTSTELSTVAPPTLGGGSSIDSVSGFVDSMFGPVECDPEPGDIGLTHHIYPPDQFDTLTPMGRMWGSHVTPTDHLYLGISEPRDRGMVLSPANGTIMFVARFPNDQLPSWDSSAVEPDYRIVIAHSCTLFSVFIHLGELAPEIAAVTGAIEKGRAWYPPHDSPIRIQAGEPIARFGGSTIDYSLHDQAVQLAGFQVPEHYAGEPWKIHTVDPFDYWPDALVAELLPKNERTSEPVGGKIDYDLAGTLAGNWFMDGTVDYRGRGDAPNYWEGHLAIAYDHIDPSQIRISIGRDIGLTHDDCRVCGGVYAINGNSPDPANVAVETGLVKYELTGRRHFDPDSTERTVSDGSVLGVLLVQVIGSTSIRTEFFIGATAASVTEFTSNAVVYRR